MARSASARSKRKRVLIITGDAAEALEVMYPYQRLLEAGVEAVIAAPAKKTLRTVVHDFEPGFDTYTEKPGYRVDAHIAFAKVDPKKFDALLIPGGRAPEYIRNDKDCLKIVRHFFAAHKPVAAICHAALILLAAGVIEKGCVCTAYPALKPDVEAAGAKFKDTDAVVHGNLVSSRAWPDHPAFMREFLKLLNAK